MKGDSTSKAMWQHLLNCHRVEHDELRLEQAAHKMAKGKSPGATAKQVALESFVGPEMSEERSNMVDLLLVILLSVAALPAFLNHKILGRIFHSGIQTA